MKIRLSKYFKVMVAVALLLSAAYLSSGVALASNMGFKMNKVVQPVGVPSPKGQNLTALPFKNPYANAQDVCAALVLTATSGKVIQVNASSGATNSHTCGNANPFLLADYVGVRVENPTATGGILVGSHKGSVSITLAPLALPSPKGQNFWPVPYHTTAVNGQDVCGDLNLPAGGKVIRIDALSGATLSHTCGNANPFALVLGEFVRVEFSGAPIPLLPGHPSHF